MKLEDQKALTQKKAKRLLQNENQAKTVEFKTLTQHLKVVRVIVWLKWRTRKAKRRTSGVAKVTKCGLRLKSLVRSIRFRQTKNVKGAVNSEFQISITVDCRLP